MRESRFERWFREWLSERQAARNQIRENRARASLEARRKALRDVPYESMTSWPVNAAIDPTPTYCDYQREQTATVVMDRESFEVKRVRVADSSGVRDVPFNVSPPGPIQPGERMRLSISPHHVIVHHSPPPLPVLEIGEDPDDEVIDFSDPDDIHAAVDKVRAEFDRLQAVESAAVALAERISKASRGKPYGWDLRHAHEGEKAGVRAVEEFLDTVLPDDPREATRDDEVTDGSGTHVDRDYESLAELERAFLDVSCEVWREIDRIDSEDDYRGDLHRGTELRQRERAAWEAYRNKLDAMAVLNRRLDSL